MYFSKICVLFYVCYNFFNVVQSELVDSKIIGGQVVNKRDRYPFIVQVRTGYEDNNGKVTFEGSFCGGSILNDKWILTAAHCVGYERSLYVTAGTIDTQLEDENMQTRKVANIFIHPFYDRTNLVNDIALLLLDLSLVYSRYVRKIDLADPNYSPGGYATAIGWGFHNESHHEYYLRETEFRIRRRSECFWRRPYMDELQICVGELGHVVCEGDSGSPLLKYHDSKVQQIGVASFGETGCKKDAIFVNVAAYVKTFINPIMEKYRNVENYKRGHTKSGVEESPFLVSVIYYPNKLAYFRKHLCSGTIIDKRWVLTTAHCVDLPSNQENSLYIVAGVTNFFDVDDNFYRQTIQVGRIFRHPDFDRLRRNYNYYLRFEHLENDIALLHLTESLDFTKVIRNLQLPEYGKDDSHDLKIAGHVVQGDVFGGKLRQNDVLVVPVTKADILECQHNNKEVTHLNSVCLNPLPVDLCMLNTGGPLYDEKHTLIGLSMFSMNPCGILPAVYGRISNHLGFINRTMNSHP